MSQHKIAAEAAPTGIAAEAAPTGAACGSGFSRDWVAGVDEAGRGPLAGPVVAAAVILDPRNPIDGLTDSKLLSAEIRTELAREIRRKARAFGLGLAAPAEIDTINILQASLRAMERAVARLEPIPTLVLVDGNRLPLFACGDRRLNAQAIVDGDFIEPCISAASILAKVCRDRLMRRWHRRFPDYGFDRNKGYATPEHMALLKQLGPCAIHRTSFAPVHDRQGELFA
jgi:ribonuclease HII